MKAIILAGGRGSRLGKLTDSLPKVLMEINGTTIIERQIKILNKIGITDITLVTGYGADLIKKKLSAYNVNLIQNEKYSTTDTLYAFWLAKHCMDDEFLSFFGDAVFEDQILLNLLEKKNADICLAVEKSACNKEDVKGVWTKPSGVKSIEVTCIGPGGNGGVNNGENEALGPYGGEGGIGKQFLCQHSMFLLKKLSYK